MFYYSTITLWRWNLQYVWQFVSRSVKCYASLREFCSSIQTKGVFASLQNFQFFFQTKLAFTRSSTPCISFFKNFPFNFRFWCISYFPNMLGQCGWIFVRFMSETVLMSSQTFFELIFCDADVEVSRFSNCSLVHQTFTEAIVVQWTCCFFCSWAGAGFFITAFVFLQNFAVVILQYSFNVLGYRVTQLHVVSIYYLIKLVFYQS